jgi:uncharacterized protein DUF4287
MATPSQYVPGMSDEAVKARTGKDWADWFGALDAAGATQLKHADIANLIADQYGIPGWWSQMLTVEYERARGMRLRHETAQGFSVSVTKTIDTSLAKLYAAVAQPAQRKKWFPKGAFTLSSQTKNKYFRGAWKKNARLEIGCYSKGPGKAQIAVQINKLATQAAVAPERAVWKAALTKLRALLEA